MKSRRVRVRLAIVGLSTALALAIETHTAAAAPASPRSSGAPLIYQKSRSFRVPFHFDPSERTRRREIQLWVSEDSGRTWAHKGATTPDKPTLTFRAEHDGEFWLAVRTLDAQGQLHPSDSERVDPSMKVIVDTAPPTLVLERQVRSASLASVRWEIRDDFPDLTTSSLEYQVEGTSQWLPVPDRPPGLLGVATWDAGFSKPLKVRATVADRAGNKGEAVIDVPASRPELAAVDSRTDQPPPGPGPAPDRMPPPLAEAPPRPAGTAPAASETLAHLPPPEAESKPAEPRNDVPPQALPLNQPQPDPAPVAATSPLPPGAGESAPPPPMIAPTPAAGPGTPAAAVPSLGALGAESVLGGPPANPLNAARPTDGQKPVSPSPSPPGTDPQVDPVGLTGDGSPSARTEPAEIPKLKVPGPRFTLDYAVDDAGPNGPALIELWVTRDGGKTWKKHSKDADRISPIQVELGKEGTYGLSLIARDAKGLGDKPPVSGDSPQMWVEVAGQSGRPASLLQRAFGR